ncbi:PD-(D/E)XK nuclease family protein [Olleya marilimosa]|uniref:PD-(D/E)XK nuclease family protein n=1 Tax=Olleya marilimosa TaxID=272164 RepID=A0ABR8LTT5_9FLAO|nr:PD-(D/E)XK nuclease family protein [Olleya marilimosa]MBD3862996.1 PD-(D/E)XK nuclease family protein [Olleya marilimosa]MBD3890494.1 PD-(D/E)XK nuclease family protein [Olleya marilimosa]
MTSFIQDVIDDLVTKEVNFSDLVFILPSRRAGVFLRRTLSFTLNQTIFAPKIISIESFVEELSDLKATTNTELLFEFYNVYITLTPEKERETFEAFTKWAQIILQDFNEIDRYLIPQKKIFDYLKAIKNLEHWSLQPDKTELVSSYLKFWNKLNDYYNAFTQSLILKKQGYQGLLYRQAYNNSQEYIKNTDKHHVFLGFNALNQAEENIIQQLLQNNLATIYWDTDKQFMNNKIHDAGLFLRQHKKKWNYFNDHNFNWINNHYTSKKNISVFGVPKNIGQAKAIGTILQDISKTDSTLKNTAVVLGDENLLIPVLNSVPESVSTLNITMGFPLKTIPLASLFEHIFTLQKKNTTPFYYKDVISILSHQYIQPLFKNDNAIKLIALINKNNLVYLTEEQLTALSNDDKSLLSLLLSNWNNDAKTALKHCFSLINIIKEHLTEDKDKNQLGLEYLYRFNTLFNEILRLNQDYNHIKDIKGLYSIYKELLSSETLDFQGEPLQGLQIMGMLESRVLDFETIIISNVNEGILPSGKTNNSFIPFDVKIENKLPTYKEKDAVYTYHFYHLLQRAKNVYILYNTEIDTLIGGEKSRFINQLELEGTHQITHKILTPKVPNHNKQLITVAKTDSVISQLKEIARKGFSPSSLTSYVRNPIDFYYQKLLGISNLEEVEETIAANTLGTVVHNTLETLYIPFIGQTLNVDNIKSLIPKIDALITSFFKEEYKEGDMTKGKNLIVFEIAKRYVLNFLNLEIEALKNGDVIKIIALEAKVENVKININTLPFPIQLRGTVDRIDECNGVIRIIDYKTGKVDQSKVSVINWDDLLSDYTKYSKSFQVLMYVYMLLKDKKINLPVEAGIISFKNLSAGFIPFVKKESSHDRNKDTSITQDTINEFEIQLKNLILEIFDKDQDFIEKEL